MTSKDSDQSDSLHQEIEELKKRLSQALEEIDHLQSLLMEYGQKLIMAGENSGI